jgi:hypothetical protein
MRSKTVIYVQVGVFKVEGNDMDTKGIMTFSAVEEQIRNGVPPFDFPSAMQCQTALNQLQKGYGNCFGKFGIINTPVTMEAVDTIIARIEKTPPISEKERRKRKNISTRLRKLARVVSDTPTWSPAWAALGVALDAIVEEDNMAEQKLIPVKNTLRSVALEDNMDPNEMTAAWLSARMQAATAKRRESLRDGAKLLDLLYDRLPETLRPAQPFGDMSDKGGGQRRSGIMPPNVAAELLRYRDGRLQGTAGIGLRENILISVEGGIKPTSTVIYDQGLKWFFDSLRAGGILTSETMPESLAEAASLDWLSKVAFQALDDHSCYQEGKTPFLPWDPIKPKTIGSRVIALTKMFSDIQPDFPEQTVLKYMADGKTKPMNATELNSIVSDWVDGNGMTPQQRRFCLSLIRDEDRQRLLLNMHTIAWSEAQQLWAQWDSLDASEKRPAMDLCVLAAILAIVVHFPFRARTVTELTIAGSSPDVILPLQKTVIDFAVFRGRIKNDNDFDAILKDTRESQPRKILDWFIGGPRQKLLDDANLLAADHRRPECLFAGVGVARYGKVLSDWTEKQGMRMTTHGFRHAIATILINLCGARLEDVARMLGNKNTEIVSRHYVMIDGIRRRAEVLNKMHEHRKHLNVTKHPGRGTR